MDKTIIGVIEKVIILGPNKREILAKIDTGSFNSSIDVKLASELKMGPIIKSRKIKSSHGSATRPMVEGKIEIKGIKLDALFHIADRKELRYQVLIGRKTLHNHFLVDPSKQ